MDGETSGNEKLMQRGLLPVAMQESTGSRSPSLLGLELVGFARLKCLDNYTAHRLLKFRAFTYLYRGEGGLTE